MMLTDKESQILKCLRENARATVTSIAHAVSLPRSTVHEKLNKFKKFGLIKKYSCLINFEQIGLPIQAKILFKVDGDNRAKLNDLLINCSNTNDVVKLGNEYDYLASFAFSSMDNLHKFIDDLNSKCLIRDCNILYVAKELKKEGFLIT